MSEDIPYFARQLRQHPSHYYGDYIRVLFVIAAVLIFFLHFIAGEKIFSISMSLAMIISLVVAAGLVNVIQAWTQWIAAVLSAVQLVMFGEIAFRRFQAFNQTELLEDLFIATLAIIFVVALYLAVRTLRGTLMRGAPIIR